MAALQVRELALLVTLERPEQAQPAETVETAEPAGTRHRQVLPAELAVTEAPELCWVTVGQVEPVARATALALQELLAPVVAPVVTAAQVEALQVTVEPAVQVVTAVREQMARLARAEMTEATAATVAAVESVASAV